MPLFYVCVAMLLGVWVADRLPGSGVFWLTGAGAAVFAALGLAMLPGGASCSKSRNWEDVLRMLHLSSAAVPVRLLRILPFLMAAAFCLGAARWIASTPVLEARDFIASFSDDGKRYTVVGLLDAPPDVRDRYVNLRVISEQIRPADGFRHLPVRGQILVRVPSGGEWAYGDRVAVTGALKTPPEDEGFSYREYLARQGIYAYMPFAEGAVLERRQGSPVLERVFAWKAHAFRTLRTQLPDPEAALLSGILLGLDNGMAAGLQNDFRDTGTSHIIAISGFNISLIAAIFASLFGRVLGKRLGTLAAVTAIALYTLLVGADAAVLRAALMGGMAIMVRQSGRVMTGVNSLVLTAAGMTFANPLILSDVGFQLSFAATLGLVLYAEPLTNLFARMASRYLRVSVVRRILPVISDAVLLTLAAQITTLPVILFHFGRLSLTAFIVNPLILPVQPAVMILGGLSVLAGTAWPAAGRLLAYLVYPFTAFTIRIVEAFADLRGGVLVVGEFGAVWVALSLMGPQAWRGLQGLMQRFKQAFPALRLLCVLVLLGGAVYAWRTGLSASPGELRAWVLDVGMGEAVLVQTPGDRWLLINGGSSAAQLSDQLGRRIPFAQRELDWLVIAGTSEKQLAALPAVLEQYPPREILSSLLQNNMLNNKIKQEMMNKWSVALHAASAGQSLDLGEGAYLDVLAVNPRGCVLLLRWRNFRMLIPAGADFETPALKVEPVTALLLPESGYLPLNPPDWIAGLAPEVLLLSVDAGNREGLPDAAVLEALADVNLLRTDVNGWIELRTDGRKVRWLAERYP